MEAWFIVFFPPTVVVCVLVVTLGLWRTALLLSVVVAVVALVAWIWHQLWRRLDRRTAAA